MKTAIKIKNITKQYKMYESKQSRLLEMIFPKYKKHKVFTALDNLDLEVKEGEILGILGKNGAGKSTLLKLITGVATPTNGKIEINGKISSLLELGTAFNLELTGIENIYQHGQIMGMTKEQIKAKEKEIIDFADIGDHINQPVKTYSSGMFARLAFATAINVDPDILIVDEVLSVGDMSFQLKCFKKFQTFKEAGKTIIFVSHNIGDIMKNCNRVIILESGKKVFDGSVKDGVENYKKIIVNMFQKDETNTPNVKKFEKNWSKHFTINRNYIEYGHNLAEVIDFGIFDSEGNPAPVIDSDSETTIKMKVVFHEKIKLPTFSMTIKNFEGQELCGANTSFLSIDSGIYEKGESCVCEFKQRINLSPGRYTLSLSCSRYSETGEIEVLNRNYDLLIFEIMSSTPCVGIFNIGTKAKVTRNKPKGA